MSKTAFDQIASGLLAAVAASRAEVQPARTGTIVNVRVRDADLAALDAWRASQPRPFTRPEAIRHALRGWLISQGFL
jgi:hypothetical protein